MLSVDGSADAVVTARILNGWDAFKQLSYFLPAKGWSVVVV